jgi:hypothetical protein
MNHCITCFKRNHRLLILPSLLGAPNVIHMGQPFDGSRITDMQDFFTSCCGTLGVGASFCFFSPSTWANFDVF